MRPHYTPKLKKRTALLRELKQVFRRYRSQPVERVTSVVGVARTQSLAKRAQAGRPGRTRTCDYTVMSGVF